MNSEDDLLPKQIQYLGGGKAKFKLHGSVKNTV